MTGGPGHFYPFPIPAHRRFEITLELLHNWGFDIAAPAHLPRGFAEYGLPAIAEWHVRGEFPSPRGGYVELSERHDTRRSYPQPWDGYEYLVHVVGPDGRGRNVSFHQDRSKPPTLRYHWHDYRDGQRRSLPVAMGPVTLRWFLEAAWALAAAPSLAVPDLLDLLPPPGPGDPQ